MKKLLKFILKIMVKLWIMIFVYPILFVAFYFIGVIALGLFQAVADQYEDCFGEELGFRI